MENKYDVVIVGAGPTGIYSAYELVKLKPGIKVMLIDKGNDIYHRNCPILAKKLKQCPTNLKGENQCYPSCAMTSGFGGSGAYSDGKFNITSEFGGWMQNYLSDDLVMDLIKYVDSINLAHGAPQEITNPFTKEVFEIEKKGIAHGLKLLRSEVRHLGTEINLEILKSIYEELKKNVTFSFRRNVEEVLIENNVVKGIVFDDGEKVFADYVLLGVGRNGSEWLAKCLRKHGISFSNNRVDVGVRVELMQCADRHIPIEQHEVSVEEDQIAAEADGKAEKRKDRIEQLGIGFILRGRSVCRTVKAFDLAFLTAERLDDADTVQGILQKLIVAAIQHPAFAVAELDGLPEL